MSSEGERSAEDERAAAKREDDRVFMVLVGGVGFGGRDDVRDGEPDGVPGDQMFVARSLALNTAHNTKTSCLNS